MWQLEKNITTESTTKLKKPDAANYMHNIDDEDYSRLKKEFGNMLPRSGVHFMPDTKVLDFLR